jgi:hypothetical protein
MLPVAGLPEDPPDFRRRPPAGVCATIVGFFVHNLAP